MPPVIAAEDGRLYQRKLPGKAAPRLTEPDHETGESSFMASQDNTRQNVVKLPTAASSGNSPIPAKPNVSALARQHGLSRQTVRRRLANGWQPSDRPKIEILPPNQNVATDGHPVATHNGSYITASILALSALALGGIQLAIDAQYAGAFGRTPIEAMLQATQGVAIGLAAMMLPSVAAVLRHTGQPAWSRIAWAIWPGFLVLTVLAGMGFSAGGLSDTLAGRAASIEQAQSARDQRAQALATAQRAADTATEARKAECAARGPRCRDREADERTALAALNTAIAAPLPLAPAIASADPGGDVAAANLTWLSGGIVHATAADIQRAWIAGRAIMPALAGLLLSMAVITWPRRVVSQFD
jgi:hypothetical protein